MNLDTIYVGILGGSYKEYPIFFIFFILFALIYVGYFDKNPIFIYLSVIALIIIYILFNGKKSDWHKKILKKIIFIGHVFRYKGGVRYSRQIG